MLPSIKSLTTLALAMTFLTSALAVPAPAPVPATLPLSETDSTNTTTRSIESRQANACRCVAGMQYEYWLDLDNWGHDDATSYSGCGGGLLDNLRAQAGDILNWRCDPVWGGQPHDTTVYFATHGWKSSHVQDALWLASPEDRRAWGVQCFC